MGKWNRRWMPRRRYNNRKYKDYDYEEPPPSPPSSPHHSQSNPPPIQDRNGSLWEIDFCKAVRVPWQKVVTAKKYMYCHENVLHWDDSAGEQAFKNAKHRYWEKINGLPSDTPLPDPDIYIDIIDWNPYVDPELISELDQEYFNPDEKDVSDKLVNQTEKVHSPDPECDPDDVRNNPWEKGPSRKVHSVKKWVHNNNSNTSNLWEQSSSPVVDSSKKAPWTGYANESSCWKQEQKYHRQSTIDNNTSDSPWNRSCQDIGYFGGKGWRDEWARGSKKWNVSGHDQDRGVNNWQNGFMSQTAAPRIKGWGDKQLKDSFKGPHGSDGTFHSGCRKREGSFQNRARYKTSRFQDDDHGKANQWQKEKLQRSVPFYV